MCACGCECVHVYVFVQVQSKLCASRAWVLIASCCERVLITYAMKGC